MFASILASIVLQAAPLVPPETVGSCAWARQSSTDQEAILTAYQRSMRRATDAMQARDAAIIGAVRECVGGTDMPVFIARMAAASHFIQIGASESVRTDRGLERSHLDQAWASAPESARNCALNNAFRLFETEGPPCPDPRASEAFLSALDIDLSERSDRHAAEQVLIYMNAKAQELIVAAFIARLTASEAELAPVV